MNITKRSFTAAHEWLSNDAPVSVNYEGERYPSVRHAFQAAKADKNERFQFLSGSGLQAKARGKTVKLRSGWEGAKLGIMEDLLRQKFTKEPFKAQLAATGVEQIVKESPCSESFWGVNSSGVGENNLGKLIMKIRGEITGIL